MSTKQYNGKGAERRVQGGIVYQPYEWKAPKPSGGDKERANACITAVLVVLFILGGICRIFEPDLLVGIMDTLGKIWNWVMGDKDAFRSIALVGLPLMRIEGPVYRIGLFLWRLWMWIGKRITFIDKTLWFSSLYEGSYRLLWMKRFQPDAYDKFIEGWLTRVYRQLSEWYGRPPKFLDPERDPYDQGCSENNFPAQIELQTDDFDLRIFQRVVGLPMTYLHKDCGLLIVGSRNLEKAVMYLLRFFGNDEITIYEGSGYCLVIDVGGPV